MRMWVGTILLVAGAQAISQQAPGLAWHDPKSGFPTLMRFHQDVFRKFQTRYLERNYYVDPKSMSKRPSGMAAMDWLLTGNVACGRHTEVLHAISARKRQEGVLKQLKACWPTSVFNAQSPEVKAYLAAVSRPLDPGHTLDYLFDPTGKVHLRHGQEVWITLEGRELQRALLRVAFVGDTKTQAEELSHDLEVWEGSKRDRVKGKLLR